MGISPDEVRRIASLAKLRLEPHEVAVLAGQLSAILDHFARLRTVDVGGVEPEAGPPAVRAALRDDVPGCGPGAEAALQGAPEAAAGHFRVPRVLG
jgi:aspartyl-tRNA(Asn)/glutamyl-tRNA(Gln) amidotransferase subunit C